MADITVSIIADPIITLGNAWATEARAPSIDASWYSATRDVFAVRLEALSAKIERQIGTDAYLLTAVIGEIGNNSFDHNLGNWPDIPGVFLAYDVEKKIIVTADRGVGVRKTISRVRPTITRDVDALTVAFTEVISGRSPEQRGNGLKFVLHAVSDNHWSLQFQSGMGFLSLQPNGTQTFKSTDVTVPGTLAILRY